MLTVGAGARSLLKIAGACFVIFNPTALADSVGSDIKVVYHMDDARSARFALHIAEDQLKTNPDMKIAVVAYGGGVDFLLKGAKDKDGVPYAPAVQALLSEGVQFRACSATLGFRDIAKDRVLEGVDFVPAGTYEIIRLQAEEGYVYLKP
jgi:intracellular sulfur oxidation DsrE/DsrF family protein